MNPLHLKLIRADVTRSVLGTGNAALVGNRADVTSLGADLAGWMSRLCCGTCTSLLVNSGFKATGTTNTMHGNRSNRGGSYANTLVMGCLVQ